MAVLEARYHDIPAVQDQFGPFFDPLVDPVDDRLFVFGRHDRTQVRRRIVGAAYLPLLGKLEQVADVGDVQIVGGTKREIHVDIDRNKLKDYETSLSMVSNRIAQSSQSIPIGKVSTGANAEGGFLTIWPF